MVAPGIGQKGRRLCSCAIQPASNRRYPIRYVSRMAKMPWRVLGLMNSIDLITRIWNVHSKNKMKTHCGCGADSACGPLLMRRVAVCSHSTRWPVNIRAAQPIESALLPLARIHWSRQKRGEGCVCRCLAHRVAAAALAVGFWLKGAVNCALWFNLPFDNPSVHFAHEKQGCQPPFS